MMGGIEMKEPILFILGLLIVIILIVLRVAL